MTLVIQKPLNRLLLGESKMDKFRYWSRTNGRFINIYAVIGEFEVVVFYEDLQPFHKGYTKDDWDAAISNGEIITGWDE